MVSEYTPLASVLAAAGVIIGLLKLRPESGLTATRAADHAVDVMQATMLRLDAEVKQLTAREASMNRHIAKLEVKIDNLTALVARHENTASRLRTERDLWRSRARTLGYTDNQSRG